MTPPNSVTVSLVPLALAVAGLVLVLAWTPWGIALAAVGAAWAYRDNRRLRRLKDSL